MCAMQPKSASPTGPLAGLKIIEMAAIGPVPFCGMVLADMGATVVRVDRIASAGLGIEVAPRFDCMARGKQSIAVDLKQPEGLALVRKLVAGADAVIEGFRPGVMERIGLSPDTCLAANPKLVFGRCSGWGDTGPLAGTAGHDINFVGLSGALAAMGVQGAPAPPLNLVGDFGGAAMHLACGVLAALLSARTTGEGQVVSTSITQGATALMPMIYGLHAAGDWSLARGQNSLDGGAPYYRCYETRDGGYMAAAPIEQKFYLTFLSKMGLAAEVDSAQQNDRATWPATTAVFAARFRERTRAEWTELFAGSDACVTPVLDMGEAPRHPQQVAAGGFITVDGIAQPASGVRFSAAPANLPSPSPEPGQDTKEILHRLGYTAAVVEEFIKSGVVAAASPR
ncbi:MAG: CaiB/BaiF CoA transferase family protein [Rhodospirillaceae bacterium]